LGESIKKIYSIILILLLTISIFPKQNDYFGNISDIIPNPNSSHSETNANWYKEAVFYHIWVKSFNDSNGDGIGDLNGIREKLPYLKDLGITALWLSPIFEPHLKGERMHGYDTVDYYKINDKFGTQDDLNNLIIQAHKRNIKVIFDYVVNHTSNINPWFLDSKNGGEKRDWYIWNKNPNENYSKPWGGGSWNSVWHKYRDSYYYGGFWSGMPDLNLDNPEVREEMANILVYWLNKGFDGIRIDAARHIFEEEVTRKIGNKKQTFIIN